ncbi:phage tail tube protein [Amycolatopsis pigmentata]|uniref:Phage tail tube protein n=1 Tax=Amycolatopsis pigmentata TaxID=450801 RepID=A0ABW5G2W9_9PSEU
MPTATTFSSYKQFVGVAKETQQGQAVAPTATIPVEKFDPEDKPIWLDDKALRGSMVESYGRQQGVIKTDFSMSGPVFGDTLGWLLGNLLGDVAYTGGTNAGSSTTTSTTLVAGTTTTFTVASGTGITTGTVLAIGTGGTLELVTCITGTTGTTVVIASPVVYGHTGTTTVQPVTAPFVSAFSTLNSGAGQPTSHTFTHFQGPVATVGARTYAGACLSEVTLKWNAETQLLMFDAKGSAWPSAPAATTPTSAPSTVTPLASWRGQLGIGGPASGGTLVKTVTDGEIVLKRALEVAFTTQNVQTPYIIQRGAVSATGKLNFIAADETPYTTMLANTQPQFQFVIGNGAAGANLVQVQVDVQQAAYETAKPNFGKAAVAYDATFMAEANTTNAGVSGGYSPGKVTLTNAVAPQSYV